MKEQTTQKMEIGSGRIIIPCTKSYDFAKLNELIRLEALQNYTRFYFTDGSHLMSSLNIGKYIEALEKHGFFTCHKSHVINVSHVLKYHKEGEIEMADHSKVPLARRRKEEFMKRVIQPFNLVPNV